MTRAIPILLVLAVAGGAGCARGARNPAVVVPYEGGQFQASAFAQTEEAALRSAVRGAGMTCDERGRQLAVTRTTTAYRGVVSREVNQALSTIEKILSEADSAAAPIPDLSTDQDYKVSVEFRCDPRGP